MLCLMAYDAATSSIGAATQLHAPYVIQYYITHHHHIKCTQIVFPCITSILYVRVYMYPQQAI